MVEVKGAFKQGRYKKKKWLKSLWLKYNVKVSAMQDNWPAKHELLHESMWYSLHNNKKKQLQTKQILLSVTFRPVSKVTITETGIHWRFCAAETDWSIMEITIQRITITRSNRKCCLKTQTTHWCHYQMLLQRRGTQTTEINKRSQQSLYEFNVFKEITASQGKTIHSLKS